MRPLVVWALALALAVAACGGEDAGEGLETPQEAAPATETSFVMEMNEPGEELRANVLLAPVEGKRTRIVVNAVDPPRREPRGAHSLHIHEGPCADGAAVAYEVADLEDGVSTTLLDVTVAELHEGDYSLGIHRRGADEHVLCDEIAGARPGPTTER